MRQPQTKNQAQVKEELDTVRSDRGQWNEAMCPPAYVPVRVACNRCAPMQKARPIWPFCLVLSGKRKVTQYRTVPKRVCGPSKIPNGVSG